MEPQGALLYKTLEVQIVSCKLCWMESDAWDVEDLNTQKTLINIYLEVRILLSRITICTSMHKSTMGRVLIEWLRFGNSIIVSRMMDLSVESAGQTALGQEKYRSLW